MMFSGLFLVLSLALAALAVYQLFTGVDFTDGEAVISGIIQAINMVVISLATFELGIGVGKEYTVPEDEKNLFSVARRTITRFVGVVSIALALEGLIMVIKYSQLDLAGNLIYPVIIIIAAALLLSALGVFLFLSRRDTLLSGPQPDGKEG
ncbi:MAG: hypothetical protein R3310_13245 [Candidatus Competibacteraceae bacterium]|nr:hypothetical protein [Candidatus Competibacteraceae bacterium]